MTTFALASEYHHLSPAQKDRVEHIIADDGTWSLTQIASYMANFKCGTYEFDIETERKEGWSVP